MGAGQNRDRIEIRNFQVFGHLLIGLFVHYIPILRKYRRVSHMNVVNLLQGSDELTINKALDSQRHLTQKPSLRGNKSS